MSFNVIKSSETIASKYIQYLKTMFEMDDEDSAALLNEEMKKPGVFYKGPYIDVVGSFKNGLSVKMLAENKELNDEIKLVNGLWEKTLYSHQESALKKIKAGKNVVISTGTGSGKTESFLLPIVNALLNEKTKEGKIKPGVRALLIYPMNALANDQVERLRKMLENIPEITFGVYTGQTKEKESQAIEKYKDLNDGKTPLKNELISREKMKKRPPHILITNYSMLEYLMLRPEDSTLLKVVPNYGWKFIVLDEAHIYTGSTGIEVSMLLRRLKATIDTAKPQFILTSATLGSKEQDEEVANFASSLCSDDFSKDDVIRAERVIIRPNENSKLELTVGQYKEAEDAIASGYESEEINKRLSKIFATELKNKKAEENLFDVLSDDETFWRVKDYIIEPKSVDDICNHMKWTKDELSAFVNVSSKAEKDGKRLFDSRYHMFIRATEGVFMTLGKVKKLSLERKIYTDDKKERYFEIATCTQCHSKYILGVEKEEEDGLKHLAQKSNMGGDNIPFAYYIGTPDREMDDIDEDENLNEYLLCPHCGYIYPANQVNHKKCAHPKEDFVKVTKVKQSDETGRVTKCIKCAGVNNSGILRSFFSGQDASTGVIATSLFEELPSKEAKITVSNAEDDGFGFENVYEERTERSKAKQFITFSDNRQAAAFFATYLGESYQGLLYSRIAYEALKNSTTDSIPVESFVNEMSSLFRKYKIKDLFEESPDYKKEAWKALLKELINGSSRNSLIGLGLMKLDLENKEILQPHKNSGLTKEEIGEILMVWIKGLLEDNAISHGQAFTESDIAFYSNNGHEASYVLANPDNKYIRSFLPKKDYTINKRFDYLEKVLKAKGKEFSREEIENIMRGCWKHFLDKGGLLVNTEDYSGKRINVKKLSVSKSKDWYRCQKCGRLTPYNVENVCPAYRCDGKLKKIDVLENIKNNHYYRIYDSLKIQPLRVAEHTAQLSPDNAYRLQEAFKKQEIDVLSCSTTFEMGVDIGDLETVFMRNMPPTPSNYIQRAGRAGRSKDSAALALTFCNKSNHDFSYFEDPVSMIDGKINPPSFKVDNEKIGIRHLYSAVFAYFWKQRPDYFGPVGDFFGKEQEGKGLEDLRKFVESEPKELKNYLRRALPETLIDKYDVENFGWAKWLFGKEDKEYPSVITAYQQYRQDINELYEDKKRAEEEERYTDSIKRRITTYSTENIIAFLSRSNILPKYGFPVDTVELKVVQAKGNKPTGIELTRDLSMAISDYAPGCEIVANGNLIKSRYIKKPYEKGWREFDYVKCKKCNTLNVVVHKEISESNELCQCSQCKELFRDSEKKRFIIPEFGFISDPKIKKPTLIKPQRTYRTDASLITKGDEKTNKSYKFGNIDLKTVAIENGEIAILNTSDFYVCDACGYSEGTKEDTAFTNTKQKEHKNPQGYKCMNRKLIKRTLGYRFKTDAIYIELSKNMTYDVAYSVLQSLILSACSLLNIDNNEVSGCLQYLEKEEPSYAFIIYDTTPGGAGHVKRFNNEEIMRELMERAYRKANDCSCGGAEADTSCYKCLRTYYNQQHHDEIKRRYVIDVLRDLFA